jgi:hypothetical protein
MGPEGDPLPQLPLLPLPLPLPLLLLLPLPLPSVLLPLLVVPPALLLLLWLPLPLLVLPLHICPSLSLALWPPCSPFVRLPFVHCSFAVCRSFVCRSHDAPFVRRSFARAPLCVRLPLLALALRLQQLLLLLPWCVHPPSLSPDPSFVCIRPVLARSSVYAISSCKTIISI